MARPPSGSHRIAGTPREGEDGERRGYDVMASLDERNRDEQLSYLEEKFAISTRLTIVERDLAADKEAVQVAKIAEDKRSSEHNHILDSLNKALVECMTASEYTRRHEQLEHRISDMERTMWKMIGGLVR